MAPPLPTYAVGTHRVSFVITRPEPALAVPQAIYFVKAETEQFDIPIRLSEPPDNKSTACTPSRCAGRPPGRRMSIWSSSSPQTAATPYFRRYAKEPAYTLRADLCRSLSKAGHASRFIFIETIRIFFSAKLLAAANPTHHTNAGKTAC
jgi:hypothetical protein